MRITEHIINRIRSLRTRQRETSVGPVLTEDNMARANADIATLESQINSLERMLHDELQSSFKDILDLQGKLMEVKLELNRASRQADLLGARYVQD